MISMRDVTIRYRGADRDAVSAVTCAARDGDVTVIVGPNGSGKSTLVRALLGTVAPRSGQIAINGGDIQSMSRKEIAKLVAVVPQREESVFPLSVRDYVSLGRLPFQGTWTASARQNDDAALIDSALARAEVDKFAERRTDELSGGEWQRTRIARALAQNCGTVVLDEPTTFLDVGHEMAVFELARALAGEGKAVLIVSHQINIVTRFADSMLLLREGRVVASGSPHEVMQGDLLERVYEWPLVVVRDPATGAPTLVPLRRR
jgi:iron complex transport system ATP-binding protein